MYDQAIKVAIQGLDDAHQFLGDSMVESSRAMVSVGCQKLSQVHEHHVQRAVPFMFKDLAEDKDVVD